MSTEDNLRIMQFSRKEMVGFFLHLKAIYRPSFTFWRQKRFKN